MSRTGSSHWSFIALDHVFCLFVISPMIPTFYRSAWTLYVHYIFPGNTVVFIWLVVGIGNLGAVPLYLLQNRLVKWFGNPHPITWLVVYHVFLFIFALIGVAQWAGMWMMLDHYTGVTLPSAWTSVGVALLVLTTLNCFRTVPQTAPFAIAHDTSRDTLVTPTRFDQHKVRSSYLTMQ